jgi:hypothetical protein
VRRLSGFHFPRFFPRSYRNFLSVVLEGTRKLALDTAQQTFRRNDLCRRTEAENPGYQFKLSADVKRHPNASAFQFPALLRRMPHARADIFRNVGAKNDLHIEWIFLDEAE